MRSFPRKGSGFPLRVIRSTPQPGLRYSYFGINRYAESGRCSPCSIGKLHRSRWKRLGLKQHSQSSFALACSLAVDLGHTCLFPALTTGGCLHLLGKTLALDAAAFAEYMITNQIDVLKIVPSHLRALLTHGREVLPRRWLILGGEPFSVDLYNRIKEVGGAACGVVNHYGPTETTVGCLMNHVRAHEQILLPPILSIGKPLPGYRSYVLDEAMRPVGINMPGELFIGGTGVARGYLNQPSETAARFVPDPFSSEPGQRLYRTGDLARERRDGRIQVLGRIDDQVKIRGHRVEPAEVEAVIAQHPAVGAAAVLAQVDYNGVPCLIAYLTPRSGVASDTKEVEAAFAAQLPPALLPSLFVWRDRLPLNQMAKLTNSSCSSQHRLRVLQRQPIQRHRKRGWKRRLPTFGRRSWGARMSVMKLISSNWVAIPSERFE